MGLNVTIDDDLARHVQGKIDAGEFGSPSEVVASALRILESLERTGELMDSLGPEDIACLRAA